MTQLRSQLVLRGQGHIKPGLRERCPQMTQQPSRRVRTLRNRKNALQTRRGSAGAARLIAPLLRPLPPTTPPPTLFSEEESVSMLKQVLERMRTIAEEMKRIARSKWK